MLRTAIISALHQSFKLTYRRSIYIFSRIQRNSVVGSNDISNTKKKMDCYFIDHRVQTILQKITGLDLEKIFQSKKCDFAGPVYKFLTDEQLEAMREDARKRALAKLQMPPVMEAREKKSEVLSYDPIIQGYEENNVLFIDISQGVPERERIITVREPDGTLRTANHAERFRMNQTFFPREGRKMEDPILFQNQYLQKLLDEESYIFVLDLACIQFEPDDVEYHRVTEAAYEHINKRKKFHDLRSTRHFGPLSFYLAWNNKIENLLVDMIDRELIEDAFSLIKLLYILHPELKVAPEDDIESRDYMDVIKEYIKSNTSERKPNLELAIQTYIDVQEHKNVKDVESAEM